MEGEGEGEDGAGAEEDADSEVEMEEVSGYHFMDCMPLFVSYVYVTSGERTAYFFMLCLASRL